MSFEKLGIISIDNLHKKAEESLNKSRINMDDFEGVYRKEDIEKDKSYVEKNKLYFEKNDTPEEKEAKKLATIFEAILQEHAELSEWLGGNVFTVATSEYDDIANGVDMIAEFRKRGRYAYHLGMAVDVTYCLDLNKKFEKIKEDINSGRLSTIRYFKSENNDFMGRLAQVPKTIIGADTRTVNELMEFWYSGKKKELAKHPIQFQILEQILAQLKVFQEYAIKQGKESVADKYETAEKIISEIYEKRKRTVEDSGARDEMSRYITEHLKMFS